MLTEENEFMNIHLEATLDDVLEALEQWPLGTVF
jgi:hypothetical protein